MKEELIVLLSGPLLQIIFWIVFRNVLNINDLEYFDKYNKLILIFNILPIYTLDGGKLLNLILEKVFSYKKSLYISLFISFIIIFFLLCLKNTLINYLVILLVLIKLIDILSNVDIIYNKFLIERYLYSFKYKRKIIINNMNSFMRSKNHIVKINDIYITEKMALKKIYNK